MTEGGVAVEDGIHQRKRQHVPRRDSTIHRETNDPLPSITWWLVVTL